MQTYVSGLKSALTLHDGRLAQVRPVRPDDKSALVEMFQRCNQHDLYCRFFQTLQSLPDQLAERLTRISYDREMGLAAFLAASHVGPRGKPTAAQEMIGIVHLFSYSNGRDAEFAVIVRTDMKGKGIGYYLMSRILVYAGEKGIKRVIGYVRRDNPAMLTMSQELGFMSAPGSEDDQFVRMIQRLTSGEPASSERDLHHKTRARDHG